MSDDDMRHQDRTTLNRLSPEPWGLHVTFAVLLIALADLPAHGDVVGTPIVLNDNGAWSWFEDERILIDPVANKLVVGSVADAAGAQGAQRNGDIDLISYDLGSGKRDHVVLHAGLQADDHNAPALLIRPDGRYLAVWNTHGSTQLHYHRVSTNPGDITSWSDIATFDNGARATYANVYRLADANGGAGRIYNFTRTIGFNPNYNISDDEGLTWSYGGRLMSWTTDDLAEDPDYTGIDGRRPYVRYTSNNTDEIHFITTEDHPRAYNNNIFHGYLKLVDGEIQVFHSNGASLGPLSTTNTTSLKPNSFTQVFDGDANNVAWTSDIELDSQGRPYVAFSVQKDSAGLSRGQGGWDHRYYYGRWDGAEWQVSEMAFGGTKLYAGEDDYTGNIALDPDNPNVVYISTNVHPATKTQLLGADGIRHHELFRGETNDGGATWSWSPLTYNSRHDNLRPIVPKWDAENTAVAWMQGTYTTYTDYDLRVVALVNPPQLNPREVIQLDFGATGQIVQQGFLPFTHEANPASGHVTKSYSTPFAQEGSELEITVGSESTWGFRDRGDDVGGPLGRVQDDFVFANDMLHLTIGNLKAGDYHLVLYSHDRNFLQTTYEVQHAGQVLGKLTPETGTNPQVGTVSSRVSFSTDGSGSVKFVLAAISPGTVVLNGFELYAVDYISPTPVAGDIDGNGVVDVADYAILLKNMHTSHFGKWTTESLAFGDLNGDLLVDFTDLVEFRIAYEQVHGTGALAQALSASVPEPATSLLVALVVAKLSLRGWLTSR